MLNNYIDEFVAIADFLTGPGKANIKKTLIFIIIEKKEIEKLLDRNRYDTSLNKLKIWKALNWIDTDDRHLTRRIYDKASGVYRPYVKIYLQVYETLKKLNIK